MSETSKAEAIHKAVELTFESIVKKTMADNPQLSRDQARIRAMDTKEFSDLHRAEKKARLGEGY